MSDTNTGGVSAEQMVAVYDGVVAAVMKANETLGILAEKVRRIAQKIAAQNELKTALRWAAVYNRPLYERHQHTKKLRIRKKYEKRILAWYRTEVLLEGGRGR